MTIEQNLNGSYVCSTIDQYDQYVKKIYYGYTKKEAKALFLDYLNEIGVEE